MAPPGSASRRQATPGSVLGIVATQGPFVSASPYNALAAAGALTVSWTKTLGERDASWARASHELGTAPFVGLMAACLWITSGPAAAVAATSASSALASDSATCATDVNGNASTTGWAMGASVGSLWSLGSGRTRWVTPTVPTTNTTTTAALAPPRRRRAAR